MPNSKPLGFTLTGRRRPRLVTAALLVVPIGCASLAGLEDTGSLYGKLYETGGWSDLGAALESQLSSQTGVPFAAAMKR